MYYVIVILTQCFAKDSQKNSLSIQRKNIKQMESGKGCVKWKSRSFLHTIQKTFIQINLSIN